MDAVLPGFVGAGGHDAPLMGEGPDDDGLSADRGIVPHFDGCIESVHVQVQDAALPAMGIIWGVHSGSSFL